MRRLLPNASALVRSFIDTYATVLFSDRWLTGLFILAATMIDPAVGITGILGTLWAVLLSRILGFETWDGRTGLYAFNSMLACLGVGYFFPIIDNHYVVWLTLTLFVSTLTLFVFVVIHHLSTYYLRLPSMSVAFSTTAVLLSFFSLWFPSFNLFSNTHVQLLHWQPTLPHFWIWYFKSMGSIFFQTGFVAGLLVTLGLALASRFGLLLSLLGYAVSYLFIGQVGLQGLYDISYLGLNGILAALAIGGIFLVPSRTSFFLAAVAALVSVFMTLALQSFFYRYTLPPFAFPFNLTVMLLVYALGRRLHNRKPYVVNYGVQSPENSLRYYLARIKRFYQTGVPQFYLPFKGQWRITQGNRGDITHKQQWSYAWDFEVYGADGAAFRDKGDKLDDYYTYRKPVLASADGWVVRVVDGIEDNPVGQINTMENWGNLVVLQHIGYVYTMYCHLNMGSVKVKEGEWVRRGDRLGAAGNSGRSAVPHLHFNVQPGPEPGSPTLAAFLVNYRTTGGENEKLTAFGVPEMDEEVAPLAEVLNLQDRLHLKVEDRACFEVTRGKHVHKETWDVRVDLPGNLTLVSDQGAKMSFSVYDGIYNTLDFSGNRRNALWGMAALLTRLPFESDRNLAWNDQPSFRVYLPRILEQITMLLYPFFHPLRIDATSTSTLEGNTIRVKTQVSLVMLGRILHAWSGEMAIEQYSGLSELTVNSGKRTILKASRIEENPS